MNPPTPTHYWLHVGEGRNLFYIIARRDGTADWHIIKVFHTRAQAEHFLARKVAKGAENNSQKSEITP